MDIDNVSDVNIDIHIPINASSNTCNDVQNDMHIDIPNDTSSNTGNDAQNEQNQCQFESRNASQKRFAFGSSIRYRKRIQRLDQEMQ